MTNISLDDYTCCLISFNSENNATTTIRAYKKQNPSQCFDIVFFSTSYLQLPSLFEEPSMMMIQQEKMLHVLSNLPDGLRKSISLFRFGEENSEKYVASLGYSIQKPVLDTDWIPPNVVASKHEWSEDSDAKERLSEISFFYLNSMHLNEGLLYLSIVATNSKDKRYHLYCQNAQYLQIPSISTCEPFRVANRMDTIHVVNKIGLDMKSNISLLTTLAEKVPVQILCSNFLISPIPNN